MIALILSIRELLNLVEVVCFKHLYLVRLSHNKDILSSNDDHKAINNVSLLHSLTSISLSLSSVPEAGGEKVADS